MQHLTLLGHMAPVAADLAVLDLLGSLAGLRRNRLVDRAVHLSAVNEALDDGLHRYAAANMSVFST